MNDESNNPVTEIAKAAIKKKIMAWAMASFVSLLPLLLGIIVFLTFAAMIILPIAGLFGDGIDFANEESGDMSKEEKAFKEKLDERVNYWDDRKVEVDPSLALSIILYEAEFSYDDECDMETEEDCFSDKRNYKKLIKEIPEVIDNMVEEVQMYSCSSQIIEEKTICETDENGQVINPNDCRVEIQEPTYKDPVVCGKTLDSCKNICIGEYTTSEKSVYQLTSEVDYINWLKEDFLPKKLDQLDIDIPSDSVLKEELLEKVVGDVMAARTSIDEDSSIVQFLGNNLRSFGTAGPIEPEILEQLVSPMGSQRCNQTACFGVYGYNNPTRHNAVDIGNNGGNPLLYSIYSGKVISIVYGSGNCKPNFDVSPICGSGCVATSILIEHDIMVGGVTKKLYSKYVHLLSVSDNIKVGDTVATGQLIGVMGNTGCSTAAHLHFEIWSHERKRHNPEELLQKVNCIMISNCELARERYL